MPLSYSLTLPELRRRLRERELTPTQLVRDVLEVAAEGDRHHVWIHRISEQAVLARARRLEADPAAMALPLYGIPFAVKDNIDVENEPTSAACPAFSYSAPKSATAVQKLLDAGAILIGKTNLDQFAAGLVGTRSPYGACTNAFNPRYISGGSSSGSAVAVALNLVSFALGTDTAGSGRVPAAFNNIVGLKPTRGSVSTLGVVPACRSLDCVSVFAFTVQDAWDVYQVMQGYDAADAYSRKAEFPSAIPQHSFRCAIPRSSQLDFYGDSVAGEQFSLAIKLIERAGGSIVEIDYAPFSEAAAALYQGPWLAERLAGIKEFFVQHQKEIHPVTRSIVARGANFTAVDAFDATDRLQTLKRLAETELCKVDVLAVPTAPTIYTIEQVAADPLKLNFNLGLYTNFVNLLDLAAISVPSGIRSDGLPCGITLVAPAFSEPFLCKLGARLHRLSELPLGATQFRASGPDADFSADVVSTRVTLAVVGAHLSGMPLNHQLTDCGARLLGSKRTAAHYRLYLLPGTTPSKPGLVHDVKGKGHCIDVELWSMPVDRFGEFVARIPSPLAIGTLVLEDQTTVQGFLCESHAVTHARDISEFGGWRNFVAGLQR